MGQPIQRDICRLVLLDLALQKDRLILIEFGAQREPISFPSLIASLESWPQAFPGHRHRHRLLLLLFFTRPGPQHTQGTTSTSTIVAHRFTHQAKRSKQLPNSYTNSQPATTSSQTTCRPLPAQLLPPHEGFRPAEMKFCSAVANVGYGAGGNIGRRRRRPRTLASVNYV